MLALQIYTFACMYKLFSALFCMLVGVWSCVGGGGGVAPSSDTIPMGYASGIVMEDFGNCIVATVKDPWKEGVTLARYVLADSAAIAAGGLPGGTLVRVPLRRLVAASAPHAALIGMLCEQGCVAGVCDPGYMKAAYVAEGLAEGKVADCGSALSPNWERIVGIGADAVLVLAFEQGTAFSKVAAAGVPVVECAEYMERSALGRAEWMRFYGRLFGCAGKADSLFCEVERRYAGLRTLAATDGVGHPSAITERVYGSVWYVPGGRSSAAGLMADAGMEYVFRKDTRSGSLPLPFEKVLYEAAAADVWLLNHDGGLTLAALAGEKSGYGRIKAFRDGNVWGVDVSATDYFEQLSWRPDTILRDYAAIAHPGLGLGIPAFYKRLR